MRLIIPDNLNNYDLFKKVKILMDGMNLDQFKPYDTKNLQCLYDLIKLSNPNLTEDNFDFIYNVIFSKKGLVQVVSTMADYLNIDLESYDYVDYNYTEINIRTVTTSDFNKFLTLFNKSLNALMFYGTANINIRTLIQIIELEFLSLDISYEVYEFTTNSLMFKHA